MEEQLRGPFEKFVDSTLLLRVGTLWRCDDGLFSNKLCSRTFQMAPLSLLKPLQNWQMLMIKSNDSYTVNLWALREREREGERNS
jgi:hypothetical protein